MNSDMDADTNPSHSSYVKNDGLEDMNSFMRKIVVYLNLCTTNRWPRAFKENAEFLTTPFLHLGDYNKICVKRPLSKTPKNIVFKTNYRLMKVKTVAEFCNTLDLH